MGIIPKEIITIKSALSDGKIFLYIAGFFIISYLIVSLLTWSFIKPLKYLGIPTIIVGVLFTILRFTASVLLNVLNITSSLSLVEALLPSVLKPMLVIGILCVVIGILMIVLYSIINKNIKKDKIVLQGQPH